MTSELRKAKTPDHIDIYEHHDPYLEWLEAEGVKVIKEYVFEDLSTVELGPWERKGGSGVVINIPIPAPPNDAHLIEIKPGGKSEPEHHMYEEYSYIVSGRGATSIWMDEKHKQTFEWHAGSLIVIPLNTWYQHFNASGSEPARYLSKTNAPPVVRQWRNMDFIFNNPFRFTDRYSEDDTDFFSGAGKLYKQGNRTTLNTTWVTNFVPNADTMPLYEYEHRGAGGINTHFEFAGNVTKSHISEFPVGTYKKAHRHGPGAHLLILGGVGFSLLWWEGKERIRADWKKGSMIAIPAGLTFHQHFNTGTEPARYLAMRAGSGAPGSGAASEENPTGRLQVEYEDEARDIHEIFESVLAEHGAPCRMKAFIPYCTGEVGPTSERDT